MSQCICINKKQHQIQWNCTLFPFLPLFPRYCDREQVRHSFPFPQSCFYFEEQLLFSLILSALTFAFSQSAFLWSPHPPHGALAEAHQKTHGRIIILIMRLLRQINTNVERVLFSPAYAVSRVRRQTGNAVKLKFEDRRTAAQWK